MDESRATEEPLPLPQDPPSRRRLRRSWLVGAGVAIVAAALMIRGPASTSRTGTSGASRRAPDFRLSRVDDPNRQISLADYRGRPLVLNFWASWCLPCRKEMPAFQAVASELTGHVAFLGMNEQDTQASALDLVAQTGVRYPSVVDSNRTLAAAYSLRGLPDTVFISPAGELLELHVGEFSAVDLRAAITRLFKV
jgi:cytochrome c biogenesis protein CcmG/thiol:disulfide interchange protein DsbE